MIKNYHVVQLALCGEIHKKHYIITLFLLSCRSLVNDLYRTDLILMYPPFMIALACIYVASSFQERDIFAWFEELRVDMNVVSAYIHILSNSENWNLYVHILSNSCACKSSFCEGIMTVLKLNNCEANFVFHNGLLFLTIKEIIYMRRNHLNFGWVCLIHAQRRFLVFESSVLLANFRVALILWV